MGGCQPAVHIVIMAVHSGGGLFSACSSVRQSEMYSSIVIMDVPRYLSCFLSLRAT